MEIYIGNLPNQLKPAEFRKIITSVLLPTSFADLVKRLVNKTERVAHSEFDLIDKKLGDTSVRYALAIIEPDGIALRALQRLDCLSFQGCSLRARKYITRNSNNDRRGKLHKNLYAVNIYNRRIQERRNA